MKISLLLPIVFATCLLPWTATAHEKRPHIQIRGIYGGLPPEVAEGKTTLSALGVNAVWFGSGGVTRERVELVRAQGAKFYAEFNTLHVGTFLKEHPDAAPVGVDGLVSPPPEGWQGICPTHPA